MIIERAFYFIKGEIGMVGGGGLSTPTTVRLYVVIRTDDYDLQWSNAKAHGEACVHANPV